MDWMKTSSRVGLPIDSESIKPGITVMPERSITCAPAGMAVVLPTLSMRLPRIRVCAHRRGLFQLLARSCYPAHAQKIQGDQRTAGQHARGGRQPEPRRAHWRPSCMAEGEEVAAAQADSHSATILQSIGTTVFL